MNEEGCVVVDKDFIVDYVLSMVFMVEMKLASSAGLARLGGLDHKNRGNERTW